MRYFMTLYVIICLALHAGLSTIVSAQHLQSLKATLSDNILVICTGSKLKYIDAVPYYTTGEIVEVSQSSDSPNDDSLITKSCIISHAQDNSYSYLSFFATFSSQFITDTSLWRIDNNFPVAALAFIRPLLRAPPHIIQY